MFHGTQTGKLDLKKPHKILFLEGCNVILLCFLEFRMIMHKNPKTERDKAGYALKHTTHPTLL